MYEIIIIDGGVSGITPYIISSVFATKTRIELIKINTWILTCFNTCMLTFWFINLICSQNMQFCWYSINWQLNVWAAKLLNNNTNEEMRELLKLTFKSIYFLLQLHENVKHSRCNELKSKYSYHSLFYQWCCSIAHRHGLPAQNLPRNVGRADSGLYFIVMPTRIWSFYISWWILSWETMTVAYRHNISWAGF